MTRAFMLSLGVTFALSACGEPPQRVAAAPEPVSESSDGATVPAQPKQSDNPQAVSARAAIDWDAALTDLAARGDTEDDAVSVQVQSAGAPPSVPVLLPTGIVTVQSADGTGGPAFRPTDDGYFARYPGPSYDVVVHGTNVVADVAGEAIKRDEAMTFIDLMDGAQVSLSRYGADYLVTFECKAISGGENCVAEEEALEVARNLVIVRSQ